MNRKKFVREKLNRILSNFGFELRSFRPESEFVLPNEIEKIRQERILEALLENVSRTWLATVLKEETCRINIKEFSHIFRNAPFKQTLGGAGYSNALVLYVLVKALNPSMIIESGVFRGFSTWVLGLAAPSAKISCFDLDYSNLEYKHPGAAYHSQDWSNVSLEILGDAFCFFDDHVNHAKRIIEASDRGCKLVLFDDDIPLTAVYADIPNLIPTVRMILDEKINELNVVSWTVKDRQFEAKIDHAQIELARSKIESVIFLPRLLNETMFASSPYTLVRLK